jgi:hypothetical protein
LGQFHPPGVRAIADIATRTDDLGHGYEAIGVQTQKAMARVLTKTILGAHDGHGSVESIATKDGSFDQFPLRYSTEYRCTSKLVVFNRKPFKFGPIAMNMGKGPENRLYYRTPKNLPDFHRGEKSATKLIADQLVQRREWHAQYKVFSFSRRY